ncbi:hypothetical protein [Haliangium sp.]|uniref:hypothetical protein n=1 Tax=Haliangium sp. TaxID=2663208 RepID=UPI003D1427FB
MLAAAPFAASCYDTASHVCVDGLRCPPGWVCVDGADRCFEPVDVERARACVGKEQDERCIDKGADGVCRDDLCATIVCGNGRREPGERCDDGNTTPGDGCSSDCQLPCGDGTLDDGEFCDTDPPIYLYCVDERYDLGALDCDPSCKNITTDRCQSFSWTPSKHDIPTDWQLADVWAAGPDEVYAAGFIGPVSQETIIACSLLAQCGLLVRYDGATWSKVWLQWEVPPLTSVWGTADGQIHVVGTRGHALHYDRENWTRTELPMDMQFASLWGDGRGHLIAVGQKNWFSGEEDYQYEPLAMIFDGHSWIEMELPIQTQPRSDYLANVWGTDINDVYAVGEQGWISHYDGNDQYRWTLQRQVRYGEHLLAVAGHGDTLLTVGSQGAGLRLRGSAWEPMPTGEDGLLLDVSFTTDGTALVVGDDGVILRHDTNSDDWQRESNISAERLWAVTGTSGKVAIAVGENGTILHRRGVDWARLSIPPVPQPDTHEPPTIHHLRVDDMGCTYIAALSDYIYIMPPSPAEPGELVQLPVAEEDGIGPLWGEDCGADLYVYVGDEGLMRRVGGEWRPMDLPDSRLLRGLWRDRAGNTFALINKGERVVRHDGGDDSEWEPVGAPLNADLRSIHGTPNGELFVVGRDGAAFVYEGHEWRDIRYQFPIPLRDVWGTSPDDIYAAGDQGTIIHYDGVTWTRQSTPFITDELETIWGVSSNQVFVGDTSGQLGYYSGTEWSPVRSPTRAAITAVWASGWPGQLIIGTATGEVYRAEQFATSSAIPASTAAAPRAGRP